MRPRRRSASLAARTAARLIGSRRRDWAAAITAEVDAIEDDGAALSFALGCLRAAACDSLHSKGALLMNLFFGRVSQPQLVGLLCAFAAVACGIGYLQAAGAPPRLAVVNLLALAVALSLFGFGAALRRRLHDHAGKVAMVLGVALILTALFGTAADGATRWIVMGPLALQPSLILLPLLLVIFARRADGATAAGIVAAAVGLALQPDRGMAGVMVAALGLLFLIERGRWTAIGLAASAGALLVTLLRTDVLPQLPYVDGILFSAFSVSPLIGLLLWIGGLLLAAPAVAAVVSGRADRADRAVWLVFGVTWLAALAAAAIGNYPTPLVGYGGSPIVGYLLSLALAGRELGAREAAAVAGDLPGTGTHEASASERRLAAC